MRILWKDVIFNGSCDSDTLYTDVINAERSIGDMALLITSSAGTLAITQQCSVDGTTFYDPIDGSGNALGAVVAAATVGSYYVVPSSVVAPFIRYKIVESTAVTTVKITAIMSEEN